MVLVNGPMMSLDASGTLADAITFSKWKGRNYVRERVIPGNPKSGAQTGRRSMFKFLTQAWAANSAGRKATWKTLGEDLIASSFNGFLSFNMRRWHNFLTPVMEYPAGEINAGSANVLTAAVWEENRIKLTFDAVAIVFDWGVNIFAKEAGAVTPAVGNCIITHLRDDPAIYDVYWTPPKVATWHFDSIVFSNDGLDVVAGGPVNAAPP